MLICKCDNESKNKRRFLLDKEVHNEIKHVRIETPMRKGQILDKNIKVLIREIDAKSREKSSIKQIVPEH